MKAEVNPVIAGIVLVVIAAVVGFFLWHGTAGAAGGKPPGAVGNAGPFSPGGAAVGKMSQPAQAATGGRPGPAVMGGAMKR